MGDSKRREDADYRLVERNNSFLFRDKRTKHRIIFHKCATNGFENNIYLYFCRKKKRNGKRSVGRKCGMLKKDALPEWIVDEFQSIYDNGRLRKATDPRGDD